MRTSRGEAGRLDARQESLLEIIDGFSSILERPTSALLHEYILLCRLRARNLCHLREYDFHSYIRGPFSEQLRTDLEVLANHRLIEFNEGRLILSSRGKQVTQKLKEQRKRQPDKAECDAILAEFPSARAISQGIHEYLSKTELGEMLSLP